MTVSVTGFGGAGILSRKGIFHFGLLCFVGVLARHDQFLITIEHISRFADGFQTSGAKQNSARAEGAYGAGVVRDKKDGHPALLHFPDPAHTAMLKDRVADGESFIHY